MTPLDLETSIERFYRLAKQWKDETGHLSNVSRRVAHQAYHQIIKMEEKAIPLMLGEFQKGDFEDWFWALSCITGENPIPREATGNVEAMANAWIKWGKDHRYLAS